jgi:hypothetical protein
MAWYGMVYSALRRNVIRARMKRKNRSIYIICSAWRDWAEKQRILNAFRSLRHKGIHIHPAIPFMLCYQINRVNDV